MNSHADKQVAKHRPASEHLAARRVQTAVQSDANASELQEAAYSSPQAQQFRAYQGMANGSLQARQLRTMQDMANESVQKKSEASSTLFAFNKPVQRVITLEKLVKKLGEDATYGNTLDLSTPWATANAIGEQWVGDGAQASYYGSSGWPKLTSARRQYRPPMLKEGGAKEGEVQANYEARAKDNGDFTFNAHVTISDLDEKTIKPFRDKAKKDYEDAREARKKAEESAPKKDDEDDNEDNGFSIFE